jgi:hypothetical protein
MAYYRKNKRRFDPRYFMNERMEDVSELVVPGPSAKFDTEPPETVRQRLEKSFEKKALEDEEEAAHHLAAAGDEQNDINARNRKFDSIVSKEELEEGCGESQTYFVDIGMGRAEFNDLDALINTARIWNDTPGIDIVDASPEVLDALGIEVAASEPLPSLMDEEPPLEE